MITNRKMKNIYGTNFKTAYEKGEYDKMIVLLLRYPKLENLLLKEELKNLVHFYNEYNLRVTKTLVKLADEVEEKYGLKIFDDSNFSMKDLMKVAPGEIVN